MRSTRRAIWLLAPAPFLSRSVSSCTIPLAGIVLKAFVASRKADYADIFPSGD